MRSAPEGAYVLWITISTVCVLQILASYYGWLGLSLFRHHLHRGYVCAAILIPASCFWFFSLTNRNTPGLEGWQLFSRFVVGAAAGLVAELVMSSLVNRDMPQPGEEQRRTARVDNGIDALRHDSFFHLIRDALPVIMAVQHSIEGEQQGG